VHLRDGAITGARSDVGRQELGRRLSAAAWSTTRRCRRRRGCSPTSRAAAGRAARRAHDARPGLVAGLAAEQATDACSTCCAGPTATFSFVDESDPTTSAPGCPVDAVVEEGRRRLELWGALVESVPAPETVLRLHATPPADPAVTRDEWALLALVDGHRTVADLVALAGRGEYAVVSALASLVARGLLTGSGPADDQFARRQALLAALEGRPVVEAAAPPVTRPPRPVRPAVRGGHPRAPGALRPRPPSRARRAARRARRAAGERTGSGLAGSVDGSSALQPDGAPVASPYVSLDTTVNKTLLLRLIAGVRGL
jgi:hypothetical protein